MVLLLYDSPLIHGFLKLGIATPKKESVNKTWSDSDLDSALDALRKKEISANKASKRYGIPSSVSNYF